MSKICSRLTKESELKLVETQANKDISNGITPVKEKLVPIFVKYLMNDETLLVKWEKV